MDGLSNSDQGSASSRPGLGDPRSRSPMHAKKNAKRGVCTPALSTPSQFELSSVLGGPGAQAVRDCCRGRRDVAASSVSVAWAKRLVGVGPLEGSWRP